MYSTVSKFQRAGQQFNMSIHFSKSEMELSSKQKTLMWFGENWCLIFRPKIIPMALYLLAEKGCQMEGLNSDNLGSSHFS